MKGSAYRSQSDAGQPRKAAGEDDLWVVFALGSNRYGLPLASVERVVRAAAVTPLPRAPEVVLGALDLQGRILPVFDLRHRFGLPPRAIDPADQFVIARTADREVALVVDVVHGLLSHPRKAVVASERLSPDLKHIQGVIPADDGMVLIQDLQKLLSEEEARALNEAMKTEPARAS